MAPVAFEKRWMILHLTWQRLLPSPRLLLEFPLPCSYRVPPSNPVCSSSGWLHLSPSASSHSLHRCISRWSVPGPLLCLPSPTLVRPSVSCWFSDHLWAEDPWQGPSPPSDTSHSARHLPLEAPHPFNPCTYRTCLMTFLRNISSSGHILHSLKSTTLLSLIQTLTSNVILGWSLQPPPHSPVRPLSLTCLHPPWPTLQL